MKKMDKVFRMRMSAEEREDLHRVAKREGLDDSTYMRGLLSKQSRKRLGFTLIELLVTMIIIAILASIATPIFLNQRKAAWKATVQVDVSNAQLTTESAAASTDGVIDGMTFQDGTNASPLLIKAGSDTYKSPVSPGNTVTESIGKTADGAACYLISGSNKNVDGYSYQRSSIVNPSDCIVSNGNGGSDDSNDGNGGSDDAAADVNIRLRVTANASDDDGHEINAASTGNSSSVTGPGAAYLSLLGSSYSLSSLSLDVTDATDGATVKTVSGATFNGSCWIPDADHTASGASFTVTFSDGLTMRIVVM